MMRRDYGLVVSLAATLAVAGCQGASSHDPSTGAYPAEVVARGAYLVRGIGCTDCHTPWVLGPDGPRPDETRFLSGHPEGMPLSEPPALGEGGWGWIGSHSNTAYAGPWGVSYAANLTPDQNTGLGIWTEEMFLTALKEGRHMGTSRTILPPMPWQALGTFSDDDLRAIYAYLRTIDPVANHVPEPIVNEPFID